MEGKGHAAWCDAKTVVCACRALGERASAALHPHRPAKIQWAKAKSVDDSGTLSFTICLAILTPLLVNRIVVFSVRVDLNPAFKQGGRRLRGVEMCWVGESAG